MSRAQELFLLINAGAIGNAWALGAFWAMRKPFQAIIAFVGLVCTILLWLVV